MNMGTKWVRHSFIFATVSTALACGVITASAFAGDDDSTKTKTKTTWTWNFGNNVSYGNNQTKGSGTTKEESRVVANFSQLTLALPANVTIAQGATESLTISADDNLLPLMSTRVVNNELLIEGDKNRGFSTKKEIKIRLTVKSLNNIKIKGSGDVHGDQLKSDKLDIAIEGSGDVKFNTIRADQFKIGIVGSGDVSIDNVESKLLESNVRGSGDVKFGSVKAGQVNISVTGSGDVYAAGSADKVMIEISGSGDVRGNKLIAREVDVRVIASGDADVHATEKLIASVRGSGEIRYAGSPKKVEKDIKGSGSIDAI
jgi:Putative auto-transporter adhesin, head GIN domain